MISNCLCVRTLVLPVYEVDGHTKVDDPKYGMVLVIYNSLPRSVVDIARFASCWGGWIQRPMADPLRVDITRFLRGRKAWLPLPDADCLEEAGLRRDPLSNNQQQRTRAQHANTSSKSLNSTVPVVLAPSFRVTGT